MTDQEPDDQGEAAPGAPGESASADLGQRFVARLIDFVLLWAVFLVIIVPIVVVAIFSGSFGGAFGGLNRGGFVAGLAIGYLWGRAPQRTPAVRTAIAAGVGFVSLLAVIIA